MFIKYNTGNPRVVVSSPTLCSSSRYRSPIHPAVKWVSVIWTKMVSWLFTPFSHIIAVGSVMLHREWIWCMDIQVQSGGKVTWADLARNKTINHIYIYTWSPCDMTTFTKFNDALLYGDTGVQDRNFQWKLMRKCLSWDSI